MNKRAAEYWNGIDFVKGLLIITVFLGHIIPGTIDDSFARYLIYSFHMPLFFGVSGWLFNIEEIDTRIGVIAPKYWKHIAVPWLIATMVYYFLTGSWKSQGLSMRKVIHFVANPYYHLWYVLAFLSYLIILCILWSAFNKVESKWIWIIVISAVISVVSKTACISGRISNTFVNMVYEYIHYECRLYNLIFFVSGSFFRALYQRGRFQEYPGKVYRGIPIVLIIIRMALFFYDFPVLETVVFYMMNLVLLYAVLCGCVKQIMPRMTMIEFMGKNSLPIYLYHVVCILVAGSFWTKETRLYYFWSVVLFIGMCFLMNTLTRIEWINRNLFGARSSYCGK